MSQSYNVSTKRPKPQDTQLGILNLCILPENFAGLGSRKERCWGYAFVYENTPEKLLHLPPKSCCNFT